MRSYAPTVGGLPSTCATAHRPHPAITDKIASTDSAQRPSGDKAIEADAASGSLKELFSPRTFFEYLGIKYSADQRTHIEDIEAPPPRSSLRGRRWST